jgi:SAM-dependent methyltransferase
MASRTAAVLFFISHLFLFHFCVHHCSAMKQTCYSAERNKLHILNVLSPRVLAFKKTTPSNILEIASGTGEHASLFSSFIPNVVYQPTEPQKEMHESIAAWIADTDGVNPQCTVNAPAALDVIANRDELKDVLPESFLSGKTDVIICINMIHISPFLATESLFSIVDQCLSKDGFLLTYGPYRVNGQMVESNMQFDQSLKSRNSEWGIRDIEEIQKVANKLNIDVAEKIEMPSNNMCLIFRRK